MSADEVGMTDEHAESNESAPSRGQVAAPNGVSYQGGFGRLARAAEAVPPQMPALMAYGVLGLVLWWIQALFRRDNE